MKKNKQKSSGAGWGFLAVLIILLIRGINSGTIDRRMLPMFLFALVFIAVIIAAVTASKKKSAAAKNALEQRLSGSDPRPTPTVQTSRPVSSMQRREPVTAKREYAKPDAYCVSCELSGEDHFVRDRKRRIAQLDEWLKNGLIDREEYRVLKNRFQNDL